MAIASSQPGTSTMITPPRSSFPSMKGPSVVSGCPARRRTVRITFGQGTEAPPPGGDHLRPGGVGAAGDPIAVSLEPGDVLGERAGTLLLGHRVPARGV